MNQVFGLAEAHEVARPVLGHAGGGEAADLRQERRPFADTQAAGGVAVERKVREPPRAVLAQVLEHPALDDPEERAVGIARRLQRPPRPAHGPVGGGLHVLPARRVRDALVQHHGHVHPQRLLYPHHLLRRQKVRRTVQVGAERHPLLGDLAHGRQAQHLVAAAVGQDRPVPAHERVQPAHVPDQLLPRAHVQVVGIAEDDLARHLAEIARGEGLDRAAGADGHEGGGFDHAVGGLEQARARAALGIGVGDGKLHGGRELRGRRPLRADLRIDHESTRRFSATKQTPPKETESDPCATLHQRPNEA